MGIGVAGEVVERLRRTRFNQEVAPEEVRAALAEEVDPAGRAGAEAAARRSRQEAVRDPRHRRQRQRQDDDDRQARQAIPRRRQERHARRRRHVPRRRGRAVADLGRARRLLRWWPARPAPTPPVSPTTRWSKARAEAGRYPADRHRRAAAQQGRSDGRIAEDRPRPEKGRPAGAAFGAARARRDGRPERARPGRDLPRDGRRHRHRHDQARRHRARAACWYRWPRNTASRSTRSASARPPKTSAPSTPAPTPAAWSGWRRKP